MLLIDALYINYGGALGLLRYLVETLQEKKVDFFLLADARVGDEFKELPHVEHLAASLSKRRRFYKEHRDGFSSVFCFGNVPPPIKLKVPVYTYFHNINMLTLSACRDKKQWILFWMKRAFIRSLRGNTDEWFVQTSNTACEVIRHLGIPAEKVRVLPFYKLPSFPKTDTPRTDYIFVGEYSGSKGHDELLQAWRILHERGIERTLHLTVSLGEEFKQQIEQAAHDGVRIVNHGFIPTKELAVLYRQSKATVYPSFNESFGLGLVEAMEADCDVIASDRPFVHAICQPSEVFDPMSPQSIADAILRYEKNTVTCTKQLVSNEVESMIDSITS